MVVDVPVLSALICEDDPDLRGALTRIVGGVLGFDLKSVVATGADAVAVSGTLEPDVVVVDLALAGDLGLGIIEALAVSQGGAVIALVPPGFAGLRTEVIDRGASALVESSDLRPLRRCLEELRTVRHAASACTCCPVQREAVSTAMAFDPKRSWLSG